MPGNLFHRCLISLARVGVAVMLCSGLAGCFAAGVAVPPIVPPEGLASRGVQGCAQDRLMHLVGLPYTELANFRLRGHLRVLRPGQGVTRDLMPDRLNAQVDSSGAILHLFCG